MKILVFLTLTLISYCQQILEINDENCNEIIGNNVNILLYVHAAWSDESKNIKRTFEILPRYINGNITYVITKSNNEDIKSKYNVEKIPSLIYINKNKISHYKGIMKVDDIKDWAEKIILNGARHLNNPSELNRGMEFLPNMVVFIGNRTSDEFEIFSNATESFEDLNFFSIDNITFISQLNIDEKHKNTDSKIIIFKKYDEHINIYDSEFTYENLYNFIKTYTYPIVNTLSTNNYLYVINTRYSHMVLLFKDEIDSDLLDNFQIHSPKFRGKIFSMYGLLSDQKQTVLGIDFAIKENELPCVVIQLFNPEGVRRYKTINVNENKMNEFFSNFQNGKLKRFLKGEKIDMSNIEDNVHRLVATNFKEFLNSDKYILMYFFKKNCGLCPEVI